MVRGDIRELFHHSCTMHALQVRKQQCGNAVDSVTDWFPCLYTENDRGVTLDNQTTLSVHSLLESQNGGSITLPTDTTGSGTSVVTEVQGSPVPLDEDDVFQCGRCKKQFTSLPVFMSHKKEHASCSNTAKMGRCNLTLEREVGSQPDEGASDPSDPGGFDVASALSSTLGTSQVHQLQLQTEQDQVSPRYSGSMSTSPVPHIGQPIILNDSDILSFNIDQTSLNITSPSQVLPALSGAIQNTLFLNNRSAISSLKPSLITSNHVSMTIAGQPVIVTSQLHGTVTPAALVATSVQSDSAAIHSSEEPKQIEGITILPDVQKAAESGGKDGEKEATDNAALDPNEQGEGSSLKSKKLKCAYCEKTFAKNFDLQQHLRCHTGEKPFQCIVCGRAFSQKSNVKKHMQTHKVWPSELSQTLPKDPIQAVIIENRNASEVNDQSKTDKGAKGKVNHKEDGKLQIVVDSSYVCRYCDTSYASYIELKTHMKEHSHRKVYKCIQKQCQQTFTDLDSFIVHTKLHSNDMQYHCHVCNKAFSSLGQLSVHQYSHSGAKNDKPGPRFYRCFKCKSHFSSPQALDHHVSSASHHYPCKHCNKVFTCERYLRRHLPTHGTMDLFPCVYCGKGFRTEYYLKTHLLIHSGEKPFRCTECASSFNRKDKLQRHMLIHQPFKKFKCPFRNYLGCTKEFNRQDKLKLHILTHSPVKKYQCKKCNKVFQRLTLLREHEKTHSSADLHCTGCDTTFKKKLQFSNHKCSGVKRTQNNGSRISNGQNLRYPQARLRSVRFQDREQTSQASEIDKRQSDNPQGNSITQTSFSEEKEQDRTDVNKVQVPNESEKNSNDDTIVPSDSVPTIEIIVVPYNVNIPHAGGDGMYEVTFPSDGKTNSTISVSNTIPASSELQDLAKECSSDANMTIQCTEQTVCSTETMNESNYFDLVYSKEEVKDNMTFEASSHFMVASEKILKDAESDQNCSAPDLTPEYRNVRLCELTFDLINRKDIQIHDSRT